MCLLTDITRRMLLPKLNKNVLNSTIAGMAFCFCAMTTADLHAQGVAVKGKVRDENRTPVAGVVVQIRSLKKGD